MVPTRPFLTESKRSLSAEAGFPTEMRLQTSRFTRHLLCKIASQYKLKPRSSGFPIRGHRHSNYTMNDVALHYCAITKGALQTWVVWVVLPPNGMNRVPGRRRAFAPLPLNPLSWPILFSVSVCMHYLHSTAQSP